MSGLAEAPLKVLIKAALEPGIRLLALYKSLGLHPAEAKRAVDDLVARGMVKAHRLVRKGRGGKPQVLEVLPRGAAELAKHGIKPAEKKVGRGGFLHDVYARELEKWAKRSGCRQVWFERTLGGKAFDLVVEPEAGLLGVEVCLTGSASWNASQGLKAAAVEGIQKVILAFENKKLLKAVEQELEDKDGLNLYRRKMECELLSEFMAE